MLEFFYPVFREGNEYFPMVRISTAFKASKLLNARLDQEQTNWTEREREKKTRKNEKENGSSDNSNGNGVEEDRRRRRS